MPAVTRVGDNNSGHDLCPPIDLAQGCATVFVNGRAMGTVTHPYNPHGCPVHSPPHVGTISGGSGTVFAEGNAVARIGDPVDCGASVAEGSPNVFAGG